jgi:flagellar hook-basal body complex protein FliE
MGPMPISPISPQIVPQNSPVNGSSSPGNSFSSFLSQAIDQASALSNQADATATSYAAGGQVSVDQVMIAEQQASLALDLVVQVRDRVVNAYQTIMNMQV